MLTKHIFNVSINDILPSISEMVQQRLTYSHYIQPELLYLYSILDVP